ncbi:hypothetical protein GCM10010501_64530 [Streptomyces libani subsp. rufus]|nr:hypothetical protein GCM10010501_64530 [Streptomyces libani subsp. rufus]
MSAPPVVLRAADGTPVTVPAPGALAKRARLFFRVPPRAPGRDRVTQDRPPWPADGIPPTGYATGRRPAAVQNVKLRPPVLYTYGS